MQGRQDGMRAILAALVLCSAFGLGRVRAEPSVETIARGRATHGRRRLRKLPYRRSLQALRRRQARSTPRSAAFIRQTSPRIAIPVWAPGATTTLFARSATASRLTARAITPRSPTPISQSSSGPTSWRSGPISIRSPPVRNTPPPPQLRWPLNYRVLMRVWNFAFFRPGIFEPDQNKSAEWNRGGYLVEGAAHCGACHTPRNFFGAEKRGRKYGGGLVDGWFAPRLDGAEPQRAQIVERRGHRRISAERPQRSQPRQRADGRCRAQFDFANERCRRSARSRSI